MPRKDSASQDSVAAEIARPEASPPPEEGGRKAPLRLGEDDEGVETDFERIPRGRRPCSIHSARSLCRKQFTFEGRKLHYSSWNVLEVMTFSGCVAAATRLRHQMMPTWLSFSVEGGTLPSVVVVIVIVVKGYDTSSVGHRGRNHRSAGNLASRFLASIIHHWGSITRVASRCSYASSANE
jgi:hypothetical protein